ncbi:N alpha-acetylation like protein Nat2 [Schizosaccharomyces pombe]|uniref:Uncharacterized protein C106.07c n=1 Tax=Schizosaccharomyces pombe (strain 972 / ATCC 24843) TaxID=284812 RepID=YBL7_SCHPO|nr:putative N alpha-acetylation related protein Nat2 [Schizosaccharomyces pombe]Q9URV4.1 RecName: Full=Uncharacterized protein C106.07c [Schizosaccharomyces pombe 972h-]CAB53723.1 N alpha-acetylation related protein Nat2 (predicted) [Schizosaccharomyces pombe]|eukprot:NP_595156.1 putative N alpha-acetylation related protein Nat2 [Schizosaccharomyces pombe]
MSNLWRNLKSVRLPFRRAPTLPLYNVPVRRSISSSSSIPPSSSPPPRLTITQRVKELTKKYGWWSLGVYIGISVLDFSASFVLVRTLGAERIGYLEHSILNSIRRYFNWEIPESTASGEPEAYHSSIWTELAFAYGIHKALVVARVPLTAAIVPPLAKRFRGPRIRP